MFAGTSFAIVLAQQQVQQEAGDYALVSSSSPNFPTAPTATLGASFATCTASSSFAYPTTSATAYQLRVVDGVAGTCAANDSAEILDWSSPSTLASEKVAFTAYLTVGTPGTTYTLHADVNVTAGTVPAGYTATFQWVLDLGSQAPPAVDSLTVTVT